MNPQLTWLPNEWGAEALIHQNRMGRLAVVALVQGGEWELRWYPKDESRVRRFDSLEDGHAPYNSTFKLDAAEKLALVKRLACEALRLEIGEPGPVMMTREEEAIEAGRRG